MTEYAVVGKNIPEASAVAKATGRALYGQDMNLPDMLYGKILRSSYAHARILQIDTSKAERLIGVKTVVTWHDTPGKKFIGLPTAREYLKKIADEFPFAKDKVRHIGERVAALAAIDEDTALEALDLIKVEYEELPPVFDPLEAMKEGAPRVHDEVERNLSGRIEAGYSDVEKGFRESDYVREDRFMAHILAHAPIETILEVVSSKLEVDAGDLEVKDGKIFVKGSPWKSVTFAEASKWVVEEKGVIDHTGEFSPKAGKEFQRIMETGIGPISDTWSFGSATARLRIDPETGKIKPIEVVSAYDCGLALNPLIAEGQILGGIAHGVGIPLFEEVVMEAGQIMNPSLLDYKTPLATEMPEWMISVIVESNDPRGPYGAKDMGIGVMFSPPSAIITAVMDALKADIYQLPLTPEKILSALEENKKR